MGNRAVITTENKDLALYVHWNGGRDSVEAFLAYCKRQRFRPLESDCYGWARLCQVTANFFGNDNGGLCVGIDLFERLEESADYDNGVYIIKNWEIVGRERFDNREEQQEYDLEEMVKDIGEAQNRGGKEMTPKEIERMADLVIEARNKFPHDIPLLQFLSDRIMGICQDSNILFDYEKWVAYIAEGLKGDKK